MTISEKIAHMMGLAEGLSINPETSKEGKLILEMMDIIRDMSEKIAQLEDTTDLINEELDELSDELMAFEEDYYLDDEDDFDDYYDDDDDDDDDDEDDDDDDEDEDDENPTYLVSCPVCGEELEMDEDTLLSGKIRCCECDQLFTLEIVDDDEEEEEETEEE